MQGNIRIWRIGQLGTREAGRNRKAVRKFSENSVSSGGRKTEG